MDDLLDLDLSASSSSARAPPLAPVSLAPTASSSTSSRSTTRSPSPLVPSSSLAQARSSPSPMMTSMGNMAPMQAQRAQGAMSQQQQRGAARSNAASDDAFSSLFDDATTSKVSDKLAGLSMAERLAHERRVNTPSPSFLEPTPRGTNGKHSSVTISSGGVGMATSHSPRVPAPINPNSRSSDDPWDFDLLPSSSSAAGHTASKPAAAATAAAAMAADDDPFGLGFSPAPAPAPAAKAGPMPSLSVSTDSTHAGDDDILGELARPYTPSSARAASPATASAPSSTARATTTAASKGTEPPPHVIGQLVELGFSVPAATKALNRTRGPRGEWDVERAADALMGGGDSATARGDGVTGAAARHGGDDEEEDDIEEEIRRRRERMERAEYAREHASRGGAPAAASQQQQQQPRRRATPDERAPSPNSATAVDYQAQANELLANASKFGRSMFKSANAYYQSSRAQIQKHMDERAAAEKAGAERDGRPKWMTGAGDQSEQDITPITSFRDDERAPPQRTSARPQPQQQPEDASGEQGAYRSPWRRAAAPPAPAQPQSSLFDSFTSPPSLAAPAASALPRQRAPASRPARPARRTITATPEQLSRANTERAKGTEHFKLGAFADAESAYTRAIDSLPQGHLTLLALLNNRASARLKTGDTKGVCADAAQVVELVFVGPDERAAFESARTLELANLEADSSAEGDLRDALGKALSRRARALEADERWREAMQDYEALIKGGDALSRPAGGHKLVADGLARCRKMLSPEPKPKPAPALSKPRAQVTTSGAAAARVREANAAAAAEENAKLDLKDSVDARVTRWRTGKEQNLRALLASLDAVLWPELGWQTVGMQELITDSQLKVRYMRAISKLHPDKLTPANTTTEQRLIASAVFNSLNEAWNTSKR